MRLWPVNKRSILKDPSLESLAKRAKNFALENIGNTKPIYCIENDVLFFCCNGYHKNFSNSYGFFIDKYPHTDEYQTVYKGMGVNEFEMILKSMGFQRLKKREQDD